MPKFPKLHLPGRTTRPTDSAMPAEAATTPRPAAPVVAVGGQAGARPAPDHLDVQRQPEAKVSSAADLATDPTVRPGRTRGSLPRFSVVAITLAAVVLGLHQLQSVSSIVMPAFFAINMIIAAHPLQEWLAARGLPRWLAAVISGIAVLVLLGLLVVGLSYCVVAMVSELPTYSTQFQNLYNQMLSQLGRFGLDQAVLVKQLKSISPSSVLSVVTGVLSNASSVASLVVVALTTLIFLVMDAIDFPSRLDQVRRSHPEIADGLTQFAEGIRKYWLVTTVFGLIVAVVDYGILLAVGVPLALVWAMFSFLTNYIPNVGFVLGIVPPTLLALVDKGWKSALVVLVGYCVVNFVIQTVIQPRVAGDAVGFTPTLSFLSLLLWGWVFGGLGALLALPLSLLVKALMVDIDPESRWVNALISSKGDEQSGGTRDDRKAQRA